MFRSAVLCELWIDHVASQFMEIPVSDNFAFSRWAGTEAAGIAAQTIPTEDD